jgi:hypothetical protein
MTVRLYVKLREAFCYNLENLILFNHLVKAIRRGPIRRLRQLPATAVRPEQ